MAVIGTDQINQPNKVRPEVVKPEVAPKEKTTFGGVLKASFEEYNPTTGIIKVTGQALRGEIPEYAPQPGYNVFEDPNELAGYEDHYDKFTHAFNPARTQLVKDRIDKERANKEYLASAPGYQQVVGALLAGTMDPTILMPVLKGVAAAKLGSRVLAGAAEGAAYGAAAAGIQEVGLQATHVTRTNEESLFNVAAGSLLGGALGGAIAGIARPASLAAEMALAQSLKGEGIPVYKGSDGNLSVGAMRSSDGTASEAVTAHLNNTVGNLVSGNWVPGIQSPLAKGLFNDDPMVNQFYQKAFSNTIKTEGEVLGKSIGPRAEDLMRQDQAELLLAVESHDKIYAKYKQSNPEAMSVDSFEEEISKILGDKNYTSSVPEANASAAEYRKVYDSWKQKGDEAGLFTSDRQQILLDDLKADGLVPVHTKIDDLKSALDELKVKDSNFKNFELEDYIKNAEYQNREWNRPYLLTNVGEKEFLDTVGSYYKNYDRYGNVRSAPLDSDTALEMAANSYQGILGHTDASVGKSVTGNIPKSKGSPFKGRVLKMNNSELGDLIRKDATGVITRYVQNVSGQVRAKELLKSLGVDSIEEYKVKMNDIFNEKKILSNDKDRIKLDEQLRENTASVQLAYDLLTGAHYKSGSYENLTKALMGFQTMRLLGGVTASSLGEAAMLPFVAGMGRTLRDGYGALLTNFKLVRMSADQFKQVNVGLELLQNDYLSAMIGDAKYGATTPMGKAVDNILSKFGKATGITYWTQFGRRLAAHVHSSDIIRMMDKVKNGGTLSTREVGDLAHAGIGSDMYKRMITAMDGNVISERGVLMSNHLEWKDKEMAQLFATAVQGKVEQTIVRPGLADIPEIASGSALGRLLFQFKSFSSVATNRILLPAMQNRDSRVALGLATLTMLGGFVGMIKDKLAGREPNSDIKSFLIDGVNYSGSLGLVGGTIFQTATNAADDRLSRYAGEGAAGTLLGPTGSFITETVKTISNTSRDGLTDSNKKAIARLFPFYNIPYVKALADKYLLDVPGALPE